VRLSNQEQSVVRIKRDYAISQVFIEIMDPITQDYKFDNLWDETVPDFLSGTTNKMKFYNSDPHYKNLFKYFETNLLVSKLLIVIGYGFQDSGINDYIETHFLSKEGKMIVIDPNKPDTGLLEKYNAVYIPKSVTDVGYEEYLSLI